MNLLRFVLPLVCLPVFAQAVTNEDKETIITALQQRIEQHYVLESTIPEVVAHLEQLRTSPLLHQQKTHDDVARLLRNELQQFDKHFTVKWTAPSVGDNKSTARADNPEKEGWFSQLARKNQGYNSVEVLAGNIGYIDFWGFAEVNAHYKAKTEAAMMFLTGVDALIIDLRNNGGGSAQAVQLLSSYFLEGNVHLNSFFNRDTGMTTHFRTLGDIPRYFSQAPVYILTSEKTFSAAEEFAYNFKHLKRGMIVGSPTKGGANPWRYVGLPSHYKLGVPTSMAINPVTNTNWEGVGVQPDVLTDAEDAFKKAYVLALKKTLTDAQGWNLQEKQEALDELSPEQAINTETLK